MFCDCFTTTQLSTELSQGFPRGAWCLLLRTELEWREVTAFEARERKEARAAAITATCNQADN